MTTVLITSATRDVGLALARQYADDGAHVVACCRQLGRARPLNDLVRAFPGCVRILELDMADQSSMADVKYMLGDQPIDVLISNAAVLGPERQSARRIDAEGWIDTLRFNALGPILLAQALRGNLLAGADKKVVAIGSAYGSTSTDWDKQSMASERYAYRASQAALNNGMRALSRDWAADGIAVALLHADWVPNSLPICDALPPPPEERARAIKQRIAELGPETTGQFRNYRGDPVSW